MYVGELLIFSFMVLCTCHIHWFYAYENILVLKISHHNNKLTLYLHKCLKKNQDKKINEDQSNNSTESLTTEECIFRLAHMPWLDDTRHFITQKRQIFYQNTIFNPDYQDNLPYSFNYENFFHSMQFYFSFISQNFLNIETIYILFLTLVNSVFLLAIVFHSVIL